MNTPETTELSGKTIGFIGLGLMGLPMVRNLQAAGAHLIVPTRSKQQAQSLPGKSVQLAETPAEIAQAADLVILMLPNDEAVEEVAIGTHGVLDGADNQTLLMDMGTTGHRTTETVYARAKQSGVPFVDAPVTGGQLGAIQASMTIFVGADSDDVFQRVHPVLNALGKNITHIGPVGSGQVVKLANQHIYLAHHFAICEAIALARRSNIDLSLLVSALAGGLADSKALRMIVPKMAKEDWSVTAHLSVAVKDLGLVQQAGEAHDLPLRMADFARTQWKAAMSMLGPDHDFVEMVRYADPDFTGGGLNAQPEPLGSDGQPSAKS